MHAREKLLTDEEETSRGLSSTIDQEGLFPDEANEIERSGLAVTKLLNQIALPLSSRKN